jgi:glycosyltransferase involved in cell wall biosynthesis
VKILFFANTEWYLFNFRLPLAKKLRKLGVDVVMVSPAGEYGQRLKAEGFRWIPVPMNRRSLNLFTEIRLIWTLLSVYRRERPDLVHHFTIKCVVYGSIAARLAKIPCRVNAVAGMGYVFANEGLLARLLRPFVKYLMKFALSGTSARLILQNPDDMNFFVESQLVLTDHVRLIRGSGVDTERFQPLINNRHARSVRILLATRLLWDKGVGEYVEAARFLRSKNRELTFLIAGVPDKGNPASVPEKEISRWQREGIIEHLGHVENIEKLLPTVDIMVLPTTYGEGVPRILIEAAACGLPIIATDVPGCREIVAPDVNGLLVGVKNPMALARAIQFLVERPHERVRMGEASRKKAVNEFDERIVINKTIDVYKEILPLSENQ